MVRMIKGVLLVTFLLAIVGCGSDPDGIVEVSSDNMNRGSGISCHNKDDGYFYWQTSESQCSISCNQGRIRYIQCWGR